VALSCDFLLGGWPAWVWGAHPIGAVTVAGELGDRSAGVIVGRVRAAIRICPLAAMKKAR
jgi:hypothetical protein